ncbi:SacI homology domain-containing protein [Toxoplasma gondii TgCatPRC2]|uniref:SacI homology domain-containing protein n=1 Tax=Toxoplasma gondii TgCatPRC2 TaxID=1130821 RepID=A0A151H0E7_TOXGO|nr:SacI homology domain-containing protein [Toxoplasma gondii TgCatPRC2]
MDSRSRPGGGLRPPAEESHSASASSLSSSLSSSFSSSSLSSSSPLPFGEVSSSSTLLRPVTLHPLQSSSNMRDRASSRSQPLGGKGKKLAAGPGAIDPFDSLVPKHSTSNSSASPSSSAFSSFLSSPSTQSLPAQSQTPSISSSSSSSSSSSFSSSSASSSSVSSSSASSSSVSSSSRVFPGAFLSLPAELPPSLQSRWRVSAYRHVFLICPHPSLWLAAVGAAPQVSGTRRAMRGDRLPVLLIQRRSGSISQHLLPLRTGFLLQQVAPRLFAAAVSSGELTREASQPPPSFGHFHFAFDADALLGTLAVGTRRFLVVVTDAEQTAQFEEEEPPLFLQRDGAGQVQAVANSLEGSGTGDDLASASRSVGGEGDNRGREGESGVLGRPGETVGDGRWTRRVVKAVKRAVCLPYHGSASASLAHLPTAVVRGLAATEESRKRQLGAQGSLRRADKAEQGAEAGLQEETGRSAPKAKARLPSLPLDLLGAAETEGLDAASDHFAFTDLDSTPREEADRAAALAQPPARALSTESQGDTGVPPSRAPTADDTTSVFSPLSFSSFPLGLPLSGREGDAAGRETDAAGPLSLSSRLTGIQSFVSAAADSFVGSALGTAVTSSFSGESRANVTQWMAEQFQFSQQTQPSSLNLSRWLGDASGSLPWPAVGAEGKEPGAGDRRGDTLREGRGDREDGQLVELQAGGSGVGSESQGLERRREAVGQDEAPAGRCLQGEAASGPVAFFRGQRTSRSAENKETVASRGEVAGSWGAGLGFGLSDLAAVAEQVTSEFMKSAELRNGLLLDRRQSETSISTESTPEGRDRPQEGRRTNGRQPDRAAALGLSSAVAVTAVAAEETAANSEADRFALSIEKLLCSCFYYSYDVELTRSLQNQQDCGVFARRQGLPGYFDGEPSDPDSATALRLEETERQFGRSRAQQRGQIDTRQENGDAGCPDREGVGDSDPATSLKDAQEAGASRQVGAAFLASKTVSTEEEGEGERAGEKEREREREREDRDGQYSWKGSGLIAVADESFTWNLQLYGEWFAAGIDQRWMVPLVQGYAGYVRLERAIPVPPGPSTWASLPRSLLPLGRRGSSTAVAPQRAAPSRPGGDDRVRLQVREEPGPETLTQSVELLLLCRRSCKRGGTRYNARGIDDQGNVANFVESEQRVRLLEYADVAPGVSSCVSSSVSARVRSRLRRSTGRWASLVQVRGSVPVFWEQTGLTAQTTVTRNTILTAHAFEKHQNFLFRRYGLIVTYVDLLSGSRGSEARLVSALEHQISAYEHDHPHAPFIHHIHYDFHQQVKSKAYEGALGEFVESQLLESAAAIGFFLQPSREHQGTRRRVARPRDSDESQTETSNHADSDLDNGHRQKGVLRTNCLDCLDRTNVFQW